MADHYRSADLFVFPSRTDTFGIVLIEALASGLPVAAHDVIGPRDVITQEGLGGLDEDLSIAAEKAMSHGTPEGRYDHVISNYTWEKAMEQFLDQATPTRKNSIKPLKMYFTQLHHTFNLMRTSKSITS